MFNHKKSIAAFGAVIALCAISLGFTSANDEEKNTAAARRFYDEVMSKGNLKVIDELIDPKYVDHFVTPGISADKAGLTQIMSMHRAAFPDLQVTVEDLIAKGDKVWVYTTTRGTQKGDFMNIKATGKKIEVKHFDIIRFVNGKAVEHWCLHEDLAMMQQLGVIPMPGQDAMKK